MPRCTGRGVDQEMVQEHLTARSRRTPDLESRWYRKRYVVPGTAPELSTQAKSPRVESELWQGHAAVSHDAPGTPSGARDGDVPVPILGISFSGFGWMWSTARNGESAVAPVCLVVMALTGDPCKPGLPCQVPTNLIFPRIRNSHFRGHCRSLPRFP